MPVTNNKMSGITLYGLIGSQPVRTVAMFCQLNNIPYTKHPVNPYKGETQTPEFLAISPTGGIPAITHGEFSLSEGAAICIYLAEAFGIANQWWPKDLQTRAKIHEYLHWHDGNTKHCTSYYFQSFVLSKLFKKGVDKGKIEQLRPLVEAALRYIEGKVQKTGAVAGTQEPSLADLACYNEVCNLRSTDWDFTGLPGVTAWLKEMEGVAAVRAVNEEVNELIKSF